MPNALAHAAILIWPLVVVILFRALPIPKAVAISIVAGYLLLPTELAFDLPVLPAFGKNLAASLPALLMALFMARRQNPYTVRPSLQKDVPRALDGWFPKAVLPAICVLVLIGNPFLTVMMNGDAIVFPGRTLPGLRPYDAAASVLSSGMALLPFFLARKFLAHPRDQAMLLGLLCLAGLAYSLPALFEVRMSPQLNRMVYGFFPHSWAQHVRAGGFRPLVFLEHGLRLGIFLAICLLASLGFLRTCKSGERWRFWLAALWLLMTLVLSKNLGATIITLLFAPLILFFGARLQLLSAAVFAAVVLVYPMARGAGIIPTEFIVSTVSDTNSSERAQSLNFRFTHEDMLMAKANERPLFGWGGWGRSRIYNEMGNDISVTDGTWIIIFGTSGWIGYLAQFGLLTLPIILLAFRRGNEVTLASSALCLILAANLVDLLPNSSLTPITWLMAGAVVGRLEAKRIDEPKSEVETVQPQRISPYSRSFPVQSAMSRQPSTSQYEAEDSTIQRRSVSGRRVTR